MIRVVVIDDERHAAAMLKHLLDEIGGIDVVGVFSNPLEALDQLQTGQVQPDAVFMDIEMPGMRGMELAQRIQDVDESIYILFITAYSDYAIEAFDLHSLDYVLKPVSKERLEKSVVRLRASLKLAARRPKKNPTLTIQCLGKFRLLSADGQPMKWRTAKTKELCAFLIHHAGQAVARDVILETIWPDTPLDRATAQLYTITSYLRKMFANEGLKHVITKEDTGYKMDLSQIQCDVMTFQTLAVSGDAKTLRQAVELYVGHYLQEENYGWAIGRQEDLKSQAIASYQKLVVSSELQKEFQQAALYAEKMLTINPYSDHACRQLMQLYIKTGRRTEALLCYQRFEQALRRELNVDTDEATAALYQTIARHSSP